MDDYTYELRSCISVLFIFERRPSRDQQFTSSCRNWLNTLVSTCTVPPLFTCTCISNCFLFTYIHLIIFVCIFTFINVTNVPKLHTCTQVHVHCTFNHSFICTRTCTCTHVYCIALHYIVLNTVYAYSAFQLSN